MIAHALPVFRHLVPHSAGGLGGWESHIEGASPVQTVKSLEMLRNAIAELRCAGGTIGLVPTMGALHEGHLTLIRAAAKQCDHVVASIFVNPTQFGEGEDLDAYPRQLTEDSAMLKKEGTAVLWAPSADEMYPNGFASSLSVNEVSTHFCGSDRPGHFDGVATVVCKLFNQVMPDTAFFGEKDWQQLAVIRTMARDMDLTRPHVSDIFGVPTVREADGLAMSSRNRYLSEAQRMAAATLPRAMKAAIAAMERGANVAASTSDLEKALLEAGFDSVDYAALADPMSLQPLSALGSKPARLLVAARIGGTRLIDNMGVSAQAA